RVINVSRQSVYFQRPGDTQPFRRPDRADGRDMGQAFWQGTAFSGILFAEVAFGKDPLVVIAAGNYTMEADWSGFPQARATHPGRVIVVGAAARAEPGTGDFGGPVKFGRWADTLATAQSGSNYGALVDLYAPGKDVGTLGFFDIPNRISGTSLSAPFVSGVAGQLLSLDTRLTAAELKTLIMTGAQRGNRRVRNGLDAGAPEAYVLNAYESLRAAAERAGAGLCGNEMYKDSTGSVFAARRAGTTVTWEKLFDDGLPTVGLSAQHRARSVRKADGATLFWRDRSSLFSGASWGASPSVTQANNATLFSRFGQSHDGDSAVAVTRRKVSETEEWYDFAYAGQSLGSVKGPPIREPTTPAPRRCIMWDLNGNEFSNCHASAAVRPDFRASTFSFAYSSARREIVIAVARDSLVQAVDLSSTMSVGGYFQRNWSIDQYTLSTHLFFIPVDQPTAARQVVVAGKRWDNVGFADDGRALTARIRTNTSFSSFTPEDDYVSRILNCQLRFARINTAGSTYSLQFVASGPLLINYSTCGPDALFAP
ncbi:MAG TPA: S8 family serine peptidase, partial [Longimicrobium sp.]|nr:S8 family serine peptidase [Longimicrobium sp.]